MVMWNLADYGLFLSGQECHKPVVFPCMAVVFLLRLVHGFIYALTG